MSKAYTTTLPEIETLLALGARIVRLARREKRPLGAGWQNRSTDSLDEVERWLSQGSNIGLLLGPESGLIDVESDTPEGEDLATYLGLNRIDGPNFTPMWSCASAVPMGAVDADRGDDRSRRARGADRRAGGAVGAPTLDPPLRPSLPMGDPAVAPRGRELRGEGAGEPAGDPGRGRRGSGAVTHPTAWSVSVPGIETVVGVG